MILDYLNSDYVAYHELVVDGFMFQAESFFSPSFGIEDNIEGLIIHKNPTTEKLKTYEGRFINSANRQVRCIAFDEQLTRLNMRNKKIDAWQRCDFFIEVVETNAFLVCELTSTKADFISDFVDTEGRARTGKRQKALNQMIAALEKLAVPALTNSPLLKFSKRQLCFFNKQVHLPEHTDVLMAFNRQPTYRGYQMQSEVAAKFGFEYWEFPAPHLCYV